MRATDEASGSLVSFVDLEERIPLRHPLRKTSQMVNDALASLDAEFQALYTDFGRPSIATERLIYYWQDIAEQYPERRASLIQILFPVRSKRQLMEQMQYNLLFRWFVSLIVRGGLTQTDGHAELDMVHRHSSGSTRRLRLGADKGCDAAEFVADLRHACVTPHVAQKSRCSAVDGRTTRHKGYACRSSIADGSRRLSAGQRPSVA